MSVGPSSDPSQLISVGPSAPVVTPPVGDPWATSNVALPGEKAASESGAPVSMMPTPLPNTATLPPSKNIIPITGGAPALPPDAAPVPRGPTGPTIAGLEAANVGIGRPGRRQKIPAQWKEAGGVEQVAQQIQMPVDPEIQAAYDAEVEKAKAQLAAGAEEKSAFFNRLAEDFAISKLESEDKIRQLDEDQRKRKEALAEKLRAVESKANDYSSGKIDPDRAWKNKSGLSKVLAVIGVALGGWNAGVTGGPNRAYEMIRDEINDDIMVQRAEMIVKKDRVDIASNALAQESLRWQSPEAAIAAQRLYMMEGAKAEVAKGTAENSAIAVKDEAAKIINQINVAQAQDKLTIAKAEAGMLSRQKTKQYIPEHVVSSPAITFRTMVDKNFKHYSKFTDDKEQAYSQALAATSAEVEKSTGVKMEPGFAAGFAGVDLPAPGGGTVRVSGKGLKELALANAKNAGRATTWQQAKAQGFLYQKAQQEIGAALRLKMQIDSWYKTTKAGQQKLKSDPFTGWFSSEYKNAKYATDETRGQAFVSRLAPGTDMGTMVIRDLVPNAVSLSVSLDAAHKQIMGRIMHQLNGSLGAAGVPKMSEDQLQSKYKEYLQAGAGTSVYPTPVEGLTPEESEK